MDFFHLVLLFEPVRLLFFQNFPSHTFIRTRTFIKHFRKRPKINRILQLSKYVFFVFGKPLWTKLTKKYTSIQCIVVRNYCLLMHNTATYEQIGTIHKCQIFLKERSSWNSGITKWIIRYFQQQIWK